MFSRIMIPVDLAHAGRLEKALKVAADLARHYEAELVYVGVTTNEPSSVAHTPQEFKQKLAAFAETQADTHGVRGRAHVITSHDPAVELDEGLIQASEDLEADLVVMATHIPNLSDRIWSSHGGTLAKQADASVFLVRGE